MMDGYFKKALIAGTDFAIIWTAIKDSVKLPDILPETIPAEWLDDLSAYNIRVQLSTSMHGKKIVASTESSDGVLSIRQIDNAHFVVDIPHTFTEKMDAGEIVLTIELRHTQTATLLKAERRTIPIIRIREIEV